MNAMPLRSQMARIVEHGPNDGWLIVQTKPGREAGVTANLTAQAFEVYCPMRLLSDGSARRRGMKTGPLFPRFVFARATLDAYRWQAIFSTIGVQRVLCDLRSPKGVRADFITRLRSQEIGGFIAAGLRDPSRPPPPTEPKARARWVKLLGLGDLTAEILSEPVDAQRKSLLLSLIEDGHPAVAQNLRKF